MTKKAIITTHDGREATIVTKASNVLFEDGQTAQDILNDRQDTMITPIITTSTSMSKVGQGDNVDYSANVVNGAYESMVLKGKSMVNCIQEPSSQDVVLPYEFADGQYVTINDTKESGALGVELKGQTLVNIHKPNTPSLAVAEQGWYENLTRASGEISFDVLTSPEGWRYINAGYLNYQMLKPNTKYLVVFESSQNISSIHFMRGDGLNGLAPSIVPVQNSKAIITTNSQIVANEQILYVNFRAEPNTKVSFKNPMIIEYVEGMEEWDIPYFEGMASCKMPTLHTVGKNLFNHVPESLIGKTSYGMNVNISDEKIKITGTPTGTYGYVEIVNCIEKGKQYSFSAYENGQLVTSGYRLWVRYSDGTLSNPTSGGTFVAKNLDIVRVEFVFEGFTIGAAVNKEVNIQIEESSSVTTYEPHKSSILSLPEEVVLRSLPNGVCDTFNTQTGVYTQRIEEVVLNGSENWAMYALDENFPDVAGFYHTHRGGKIASGVVNQNYIGSLPVFAQEKFPGKLTVNEEGVGLSDSRYVKISILKSKLSSIDSNGLKQWLQSNPMTIQYELADPVVTKINLSSTLKSWNTTTHIYSEIPENSLYPILSHSNPTYPVILKPSTKYSIVANSYSNNHTNSAINFNLGGATVSTTVGSRVCTVTTPSTLTSDKLVMSGRGNKLNNVMVIEGDVVGDEPYFEGMCDVDMPVVKNVGKNLFNINGDINQCFRYMVGGSGNVLLDGNSFRADSCSHDHHGKGVILNLKPNTNYTISGHIENAGNVCFYTGNWEPRHRIDNVRGYFKTTYTPAEGETETCLTFVTFSTSTDPKAIFSNIQLEESPTQTTYEPYKSNILSANGDKIKLTEDMFEQGTTAPYVGNPGKTYQWLKENSTPSFDVRRLRLKELIKIQPNTKLILQNTDNFMYAIAGYDADKLSLGTFDTSWIQNTTITIPQDAHYISFSIRKKDDTSITISDFKNTKFTLSEVDKTIVLRSLPNGVCDTLNVETGEYVQRIGEAILNGSQGVSSWWNTTSTIGVGIPIPTMKNISKLNCDKLPVVSYGAINNDTYDKDGIASWDTGNIIRFRIEKSKLTTEDVDGVKQYLQQNPITVQYELINPVVKTVDLSGYPFSYENGHVVLSSGSIEQSLTPKVEYSVATNRNGQIRSNQKMVEKHQKELDKLQAIVLANLVNSQYNQTLTTLKYELSRV